MEIPSSLTFRMKGIFLVRFFYRKYNILFLVCLGLSGCSTLLPKGTDELIEQGKVVALNFPVAMNPGLAKTIGTLMKQDFQRAILNRIPKIEREPARHFREVLFLCDEYQGFATVGESDPSGDEKFFSLARQARCIPIVATQSISSLKSTLPGETWRTLLQTFRTKIFLALSAKWPREASRPSGSCAQTART